MHKPAANAQGQELGNQQHQQHPQRQRQQAEGEGGEEGEEAEEAEEAEDVNDDDRGTLRRAGARLGSELLPPDLVNDYVQPRARMNADVINAFSETERQFAIARPPIPPPLYVKRDGEIWKRIQM